MDGHAKAAMGPGLSHSRPWTRHRGLAIVAVAAAAAVAVGIRYQANALRNNELAQKNAHPDNLYVPVDRSGGGI